MPAFAQRADRFAPPPPCCVLHSVEDLPQRVSSAEARSMVAILVSIIPCSQSYRHAHNECPKSFAVQVCGGHAWAVPGRVAPCRAQPLPLCAAVWHCGSGDRLPVRAGTGNANSGHGRYRSSCITWHPYQGATEASFLTPA